MSLKIALLTTYTTRTSYLKILWYNYIVTFNVKIKNNVINKSKCVARDT